MSAGQHPSARRLLVVVGTRPEAVKLAPLVHALRAAGSFDLRAVATGQHDALLHDTWADFGLAFDLQLPALPKHPAARSLARTAARLLAGLDTLIARERPAAVIGQGDTTSCLAAALAAFYRGVPFVHLEAGLRSGNLGAPFPEEAQRELADRLAALHLAPTPAAAETLRRAGAAPGRIHVVGNTGIDALRWMLPRAGPSPWPPEDMAGPGTPALPGVHRVLVTVHRRENHGEPLAHVAAALRRLAERPDVRLLCPVHPNPAVHEALTRQLGGVPRLTLAPPLRYPAMVAALRDATLLLTDSGGLQEEAPALGLPVLVLRDETERPEGVVAGTAQLVGTSTEAIVAAAHAVIDDPARRRLMSRVHWPYGDGHSAERIVALLKTWLPPAGLG